MPKLSLIKKAVEGSIYGTTTNNGSRSRNSSGIFLSQIPFIGRFCLSETIEFAVRATPRNKALCTNKGGCLLAVVEPLSHLLGDNLFTKTNKRNLTMLFKFLCVNRTKAHFHLCVIPVESSSETQARLRLSADFRYLATIAKINRTFLKGGVYGRG